MAGESDSVLKKLGLLSLGLTLFCGSALAQEPRLYRSDGYARPHAQQQEPVAVEQQQYYDQSGTVGRMGLGASPFHPEGPGNFTHR